MLTDRQQKIYIEISQLAISDKLSSKEKKYFSRAKKQIEEEKQFQDVINALVLSIKSWEEREWKNSKNFEGLNKETKEILKRLINIYGEPDYRSFDTLKNLVAISSNPNAVIGSPGSSNKLKKGKYKWGITKVMLFFIIFLILVYFLIYTLFL